jgi:hypothetical protein
VPDTEIQVLLSNAEDLADGGRGEHRHSDDQPDILRHL